MDTITKALYKLDADGMAEFWKEYNIGKEDAMEKQEIWSEIQEAAKKLNHYMKLGVSKGLRVEASVDSNLREIQYKHVIPRVEVSVYEEMHHPNHIYAK